MQTDTRDLLMHVMCNLNMDVSFFMIGLPLKMTDEREVIYAVEHLW